MRWQVVAQGGEQRRDTPGELLNRSGFVAVCDCCVTIGAPVVQIGRRNQIRFWSSRLAHFRSRVSATFVGHCRVTTQSSLTRPAPCAGSA